MGNIQIPAKSITKQCKNCDCKYDKKEVERIYGNISAVAEGGFCSALCYTKYTLKPKN